MPTWLNGNFEFHQLALHQNVQIGSSAWVKGGLQSYGGSGGDHPAYGWKHDHKVEAWGEAWVRAVFANYCSRPPYYLNAPVRLTSYEGAGRPKGYYPQQPGDMPKGEVAYPTANGTVLVCGPDLLHFHIGPLLAVYDKYEGSISTPLGALPAKPIAHEVVRYLMSSMAGMLRRNPTEVSTSVWDNRGTANIIFAATGALKRGMIKPEDFMVFAEYVSKTVVPFFMKAPGMALNPKPVEINGLKNIQLYNGLYWLLPAFYWAEQLLTSGDLKEVFNTLVRRFSNAMYDLEVLAPGDGCRVAWFQTPPAFLEGDGGAPHMNLIPFITKENLFFGATDWSLWGMTAQHIAAEVLDSNMLRTAAKKTFEKWLPKRNIDNKVWFVGADCEYL